MTEKRDTPPAETGLRWMKLPPNSAYPDFKEIHLEDEWCAKAGCRPTCPPAAEPAETKAGPIERNEMKLDFCSYEKSLDPVPAAPVSPEPPRTSHECHSPLCAGAETLATVTYDPKSGKVVVENHVGREAGTVGAKPEPPKFYVASRASIPERSAMWRSIRADGVRIVSTWIDEAEEGATQDFSELWTRIEAEIRSADCLVLYAESGDFPLKGALVEVGMALSLGKPVRVVAINCEINPRNLKPFGSWAKHPKVTMFKDLRQALAAQSLPSPAPQDAEQLVIDLARELYDRFVMGGWEPQDAYQQIREMLKRNDLDPRTSGERWLVRRGFADSRTYSASELGPLLEEFWKEVKAIQSREPGASSPVQPVGTPKNEP